MCFLEWCWIIRPSVFISQVWEWHYECYNEEYYVQHVQISCRDQCFWSAVIGIVHTSKLLWLSHERGDKLIQTYQFKPHTNKHLPSVLPVTVGGRFIFPLKSISGIFVKNKILKPLFTQISQQDDGACSSEGARSLCTNEFMLHCCLLEVS